MQTATLLTPPTAQAQTKPLVIEKLLTGAEALDLGIDRPFELVNGKIVYLDYPGDEHGLMESALSRHLGNFNVTRKLGWVLAGEVGLYTRYAPDTVRGTSRVMVFVARRI